MNKIKTLLGGIALSASLAGAALAAGVEVNASSTGLALQGYDPVAYFTEGAPTKGSYKITSVYEDTTYRFSSDANKATFDADPEAFLPKYGGYCAFGTAMGIKVDGDPTVWAIIDDELYLNLSTDIQERWNSDIPGYLEKAEGKWTEIEHEDPAVLLQ